MKEPDPITTLETALGPIAAVVVWIMAAAATMGFYYERIPSLGQRIGFFAMHVGFVATFAWLGARYLAGGRATLAWFFFALGFATLVPIAAFEGSPVR